MNVPLDCINLVHPKIKLLIWRTAQYHQQKERKFYSIVKMYYHIKTEDPIKWFDRHNFFPVLMYFLLKHVVWVQHTLFLIMSHQ